MRQFAIKSFLFVLAFALPSLASAQNQYSYLGAWLPPTIYQSNYTYSATAPFTGTASGSITTVQWQLIWNAAAPATMKMTICDSTNTICVTITNPSMNGNTAAFAGESPDQTFVFKFEVPTTRTTVYNPPYAGVSTNSWLEANYTTH